uniref:Uncharacterized protein n=1 Tax=Arion vulgaris TaxID=1028688 RepID=A0A0B7BLW8_9EUPU
MCYYEVGFYVCKLLSVAYLYKSMSIRQYTHTICGWKEARVTLTRTEEREPKCADF